MACNETAVAAGVLRRAFALIARALIVLAPAAPPAHAAAHDDVRSETIEYHDDATHWVLGQVKRATVNGIETERSTFNKQGLPEQRFVFGQRASTTTYHADGSVATVADGNGHVTRYDDYARGIPRRISYADGSVQSATLDAHGQLASVTDEAGATYCYAYDAMGRLVRITPPAELKRGHCAQDAWWIQNTSFRVLAASEPRPPGIAAGQWLRTRQAGSRRELTWFDAMWRPVLTQVFDASDEAGTRRAQSTEYDANGQVVFRSYPSNDAVPPAQGTWFEHDALGRITAVYQDSELGRLATRTTHGPGLSTQVTDPRGLVTTTTYQAYGQPHYDWPVSRVQPEGVVTDIARDDFGKPLRITRRGAGGQPRVDRHAVYDGQQRLCKTLDPETGASVFAYDAAGNLNGSASGLAGLARTDACQRDAAMASGRWSSRRYDPRDRLTRLRFADGLGDQDRAYTATGLPARITTANADGASVETRYTYNQLGLPTSESSSQSGWYAWTLRYGYDGHGRVQAQGYPSGLTVHYRLDALGQVREVSDDAGQVYARDIRYHPDGSIRQFTYGNGIAHSREQNLRQLPSRVSDAKVADFRYGYDANGNPVSIRAVAPVPHTYSGDRDLAYDGLDRLIYAHLHWRQIDRWYYDPLDRLAHRHHFDGATTTRHTYYYDASNRLGNVVNADTGATVTGVAWDVQGNLANKNGQRYSFDQGNRLRAVTGKAWYRYDGLGRRVVNAYSGGLGVYQYSRAGQLLYYEQTGQGHVEQIYLAGRLLARRNGGITTFLHTDTLGSPIAETDAAGVIVARLDYSPYGEILTAPGFNRAGYTGHLHDADTGLVQMQQRYYDTALESFVSVDPVTVFDGEDDRQFHRYRYAAGNPYRYRDPDGRVIETGWDVVNVGLDVVSLGANLATGNYAGAALDAAGLVVDVAATAIPGVPGGAGTAIKAYRTAGMLRESKVAAQLIAENPGAKVQAQRLLRTADGKKAIDATTGEGRIVDHAVIKDGRAKTYETTSLTASKSQQQDKEERILKAGGNYIRDRETRELVPVQGLSELKRLP